MLSNKELLMFYIKARAITWHKVTAKQDQPRKSHKSQYAQVMLVQKSNHTHLYEPRLSHIRTYC